MLSVMKPPLPVHRLAQVIEQQRRDPEAAWKTPYGRVLRVVQVLTAIAIVAAGAAVILQTPAGY